jgi:hypothetical protein
VIVDDATGTPLAGPFVRWDDLTPERPFERLALRQLRTPSYLALVADVKAPFAGPRMVHRSEQVTQTLYGRFWIRVGGEEGVLSVDDACLVPVGALHHGEVVEACRIFEVNVPADAENLWRAELGDESPAYPRPPAVRPRAIAPWAELAPPELAGGLVRMARVAVAGKIEVPPGRERLVQPLSGAVVVRIGNEERTIDAATVALAPATEPIVLEPAAEPAVVLEVVLL